MGHGKHLQTFAGGELMIRNLQFAIKSFLLLGFLFGVIERVIIFTQDNLLVSSELAQLTLVILCIVGLLFLYAED